LKEVISLENKTEKHNKSKDSQLYTDMSKGELISELIVLKKELSQFKQLRTKHIEEDNKLLLEKFQLEKDLSNF
jgi:hypothetical protein